MMKKPFNLKVLEFAIRKKDFAFLAHNLVEHLYDIDWTPEDVSKFIEKLESVNQSAE